MYISLALRVICLTAVLVSGVIFFQIRAQKQKLESNLIQSRIALQEKISETAVLRSQALEADEQRIIQTQLAEEAQEHSDKYKAQFDSLNLKLVVADAAKKNEEDRVAEISAANRDLQRQVNALRASLPPKNWREEQNLLQSRLLQLEAENASLRKTLESASAMASAGNLIEIPPASLAQVTKLPVGKVMRIGPDGSFAILSYGRKLGAAEGQTLTLRRDQQTVALVSLTQITNDFSIAQILSSTNTGSSLSVPDIQVGDTAHLE